MNASVNIDTPTVPQLRFPEFEGEWDLDVLGSKVQVLGGLTYSPDDIVDEGTLVLRSSNVQGGVISLLDNVYVSIDPSDDSQSKIGDILLCVRNGSKRLIGKSAIIKSDLGKTTHGAFMSMLRGKCNKYIYQLMQTDNYYWNIHRNLGATINSINGNDLKEFQFYFPSKPEEQSKIADFLVTVDERIQGQAKKKELLKQYKKGVMQRLFSQQLRFTKDDGTPFPDWEECRLEKYLIQNNKKTKAQGEHEVLTSSRSGLIKQSEYFDGGRLLDRSNIGFHILPENKITYRSRSDDGRFFFNLNRTGSVGIVSHYYPVIEASQGDIRFYLSLLNLPTLKLYKYAVGTSQVVLSFTALGRVKVEIPHPDEQKKIADFLSSIDDKITAVSNQLTAAKTFKKGLLQKMFV